MTEAAASTTFQELRAQVWDASKGVCYICGGPLHPFRNFHVEHVIPRCAGGTDAHENLRASCQKCNLHKAATHDRELCAQLNQKWMYVIRGFVVRSLRESRQLSRTAIELRVRVSAGTLQRIERHERLVVKEKTVERIAQALGVDVVEIATRVESQGVAR